MATSFGCPLQLSSGPIWEKTLHGKYLVITLPCGITNLRLYWRTLFIFLIFVSGSDTDFSWSPLHTTGRAVAQLVEGLCHKLDGRGFDSRWCHWNFSLTQTFWPHCGPGVNSTSNRNEYQEYFLGGIGGQCVGLTTLPPSCAECLEIWEPQPPGTLRACPGL